MFKVNAYENFIIEIVEMNPSDIEPVLNILSENKLEVWNFDDFISELKRLDSIALIVKMDDGIIGFCIARLIMNSNPVTNSFEVKGNSSHLPSNLNIATIKNSDSECEIYNIGVKREFQNRGFGCKILTRLITLIKEHNCRAIWLEVRKSNESAIAFYKKNGFKKTYERNNFYSNPTENAIVMKRDL